MRVFPALVTLLVACSATRSPRPDPAGGAPALAPGGLRSNILRADYAGSQRCKGCHADVYAVWLRSPMHRMTRLPEQAELRAPFSGEEFHFKTDSIKLEQHEGQRFMRLRSQRMGEHLYRVTKVIGGRYREDFAGVEVASAEPGARAGSVELILPASYVFSSRSFRLKGYSVMVAERPGLRPGPAWSKTCVFCHNTSPYFDSVLGALYGAGAPKYQGEVVDTLLPPERRYELEITDPGGLERALADEVRFFGGTPGGGALRAQLGQAIVAIRERLRASHLLEVGIGCESCHGGSREHVRDQQVLPSFEPHSHFLRARAASAASREPTEGAHGRADGRAAAINRTCARCHQVLFTRYPFTWEGRARSADPPGGSHINSGEARDFLLGGCAGAMACTSCHDPHTEDSPGRLAALATPAGNAVCTGCHTQYAERQALRAHAHHDPDGAAGACLACHMPQKNMGLGYALTRYHRIGSPTEAARVTGDRPLECALCHRDATTETLVGAMERFWGKRYDRGALTALYGDLGARVLDATLVRGKPHEQAVAIALLGEERAGARVAAPVLARQLLNPYPLVRYFAKGALERIAGAPCDIDLAEDDDRIRAQAESWLLRHALAAPTEARP